ncbi:MAG: hypothetical protein ACE15D_07420 [Candidatus Eisenbacteria bacterium]
MNTGKRSIRPFAQALLLLAAALLVAAWSAPPSALAQEGGGAQLGGGPGTEKPGTKLRYSLPGGVLEIAPADGWETNLKLAEEFHVRAFLHPSGMKPGQEIETLLTIDRQERAGGVPFAEAVQYILSEGRKQGFVPKDSTIVRTMAGEEIPYYTYGPLDGGEYRGMAFFTVPNALVLFRDQASSVERWKADREAVLGMLRSARFYPSSGGTSPERQ